jgi:hypothetical protein
MRFLISRIVLVIVKRRHLPAYLEGSQEGWMQEKDREVIKAASGFALEKIKVFSVMRYRLREDAESLLILIQNLYGHSKADRIVFRFSITRLLECLLLAFGDIYREYASGTWFRVVKNIRLVWFSRARSLVNIYESVCERVPLLRRLFRTRVAWRIVRVLLMPLLGLPSLIWYTLRSVSLGLITEGYLRFLYALLLLKIGYYATYLYGRKNSHIRKRIREISTSRLWVINLRIEEALTPSDRLSSHYQKAVETYLELLEEFGLALDKTVLVEKGEKAHWAAGLADSLWTITKQAYRNQNPLSSQASDDLQMILRMYREISEVYVPGAEAPILRLRLREVVEVGYLACLVFLQKILTTPGARLLLDKVSCEFVFQLTRVSEKELVKLGTEYLDLSYKSYRLVRKARKLFYIVRGASLPTALLSILGSPILMQKLKNILRDFTYHRVGRLLLYAWETNELKTERHMDLFLY